MSNGPQSPPISPTGRRGKRDIACQITLLDDVVSTQYINAKTVGADLMRQVADSIHLLEVDYFDLEYTDVEGNRCWIDHEKLVLKQVPVNHLHFSFLVKFYAPDPGLLEDEFTRYLFALQIKRDLYTGSLQCQEHTAVLLASFIVQAEFGDFSDEEFPNHLYLTDMKLLPDQRDEVLIKVMQHHKEHSGQTPTDADFNLLDTARKVEMYGMRLHNAKDHEGVALALAVAHIGVLVFQNYTKINMFSWAKIRKLSFKRKKFLIKLHPEGYGYYKDTVEFYFESRNACKNFWKKCIEHHSFFRRQNIKPTPRHKARVVSRGSSFRYSGRTQKQLVEYARDNYSKRMPFQRHKEPKFPSPGKRYSPRAPSSPRPYLPAGFATNDSDDNRSTSMRTMSSGQRSFGATPKNATLNSRDVHFGMNTSASSGSHVIEGEAHHHSLHRGGESPYLQGATAAGQNGGQPGYSSFGRRGDEHMQIPSYSEAMGEFSKRPPPEDTTVSGAAYCYSSNTIPREILPRETQISHQYPQTTDYSQSCVYAQPVKRSLKHSQHQQRVDSSFLSSLGHDMPNQEGYHGDTSSSEKLATQVMLEQAQKCSSHYYQLSYDGHSILTNQIAALADLDDGDVTSHDSYRVTSSRDDSLERELDRDYEGDDDDAKLYLRYAIPDPLLHIDEEKLIREIEQERQVAREGSRYQQFKNQIVQTRFIEPQIPSYSHTREVEVETHCHETSSHPNSHYSQPYTESTKYETDQYANRQNNRREEIDFQLRQMGEYEHYRVTQRDSHSSPVQDVLDTYIARNTGLETGDTSNNISSSNTRPVVQKSHSVVVENTTEMVSSDLKERRRGTSLRGKPLMKVKAVEFDDSELDFGLGTAPISGDTQMGDNRMKERDISVSVPDEQESRMGKHENIESNKLESLCYDHGTTRTESGAFGQARMDVLREESEISIEDTETIPPNDDIRAPVRNYEETSFETVPTSSEPIKTCDEALNSNINSTDIVATTYLDQTDSNPNPNNDDKTEPLVVQEITSQSNESQSSTIDPQKRTQEPVLERQSMTLISENTFSNKEKATETTQLSMEKDINDIPYVLHKRHVKSGNSGADNTRTSGHNKHTIGGLQIRQVRHLSAARSSRSRTKTPSPSRNKTPLTREQRKAQFELIKSRLRAPIVAKTKQRDSSATGQGKSSRSMSPRARQRFDYVTFSRLPPCDSFSSKDDSISPGTSDQDLFARAQTSKRKRSKSEKDHPSRKTSKDESVKAKSAVTTSKDDFSNPKTLATTQKQETETSQDVTVMSTTQQLEDAKDKKHHQFSEPKAETEEAGSVNAENISIGVGKSEGSANQLDGKETEDKNSKEKDELSKNESKEVPHDPVNELSNNKVGYSTVDVAKVELSCFDRQHLTLSAQHSQNTKRLSDASEGLPMDDSKSDISLEDDVMISPPKPPFSPGFIVRSNLDSLDSVDELPLPSTPAVDGENDSSVVKSLSDNSIDLPLPPPPIVSFNLDDSFSDMPYCEGSVACRKDLQNSTGSANSPFGAASLGIPDIVVRSATPCVSSDEEERSNCASPNEVTSKDSTAFNLPDSSNIDDFPPPPFQEQNKDTQCNVVSNAEEEVCVKSKILPSSDNQPLPKYKGGGYISSDEEVEHSGTTDIEHALSYLAMCAQRQPFSVPLSPEETTLPPMPDAAIDSSDSDRSFPDMSDYHESARILADEACANPFTIPISAEYKPTHFIEHDVSSECDSDVAHCDTSRDLLDAQQILAEQAMSHPYSIPRSGLELLPPPEQDVSSESESDVLNIDVSDILEAQEVLKREAKSRLRREASEGYVPPPAVLLPIVHTDSSGDDNGNEADDEALPNAPEAFDGSQPQNLVHDTSFEELPLPPPPSKFRNEPPKNTQMLPLLDQPPRPKFEEIIAMATSSDASTEDQTPCVDSEPLKELEMLEAHSYALTGSSNQSGNESESIDRLTSDVQLPEISDSRCQGRTEIDSDDRLASNRQRLENDEFSSKMDITSCPIEKEETSC